ncbi:hypothetical protein GCM10010274_60630 [Streptomyces lavendofoliae]|uniref:Secreted protein n=1 Tax=Streptomyces lavendofoliae TaxID=67314 RepID=A0A918I3H4_9ACTN|nr:hypothetical protein GCM10010274_60630 [Streptomyces lavendofoliae]
MRVRPRSAALTVPPLTALTPAPAAAASSAPSAVPTLLAAIAELPVDDERREGYDRKREFGDWIHADRDGCNTRAEVMQLATRSPR